MQNNHKKQLLFDPEFVAQAALYPEYGLARVTLQERTLYRAASISEEFICQVSGKFTHEVRSDADFPAVGDYVLLDRSDNRLGNAIIHSVLPRKSEFLRKKAGTSHEMQMIAANIDKVFVCSALNRDFNVRRIERYLALVYSSGAAPVIVLTKSDLCGDIEKKLAETSNVAADLDIVVVSNTCDASVENIRMHMRAGETVAFAGSSGVGKSTLINRLLNTNELPINGLRGDERGRHTTVSRHLYVLDDYSMVIDTPGMREIGIEFADASSAFEEIDEYASKCRFANCTHTSEPGCAVRDAVKNGFLKADRLAGYKKLSNESKYEGLNARQVEQAKINSMFGGKKAMKTLLKMAKSKRGGRD